MTVSGWSASLAAQESRASPLRILQDSSDIRRGVIVSVVNRTQRTVLLDSLQIENCLNVRPSLCTGHRIGRQVLPGAEPVPVFVVVPQVEDRAYRFRVAHTWRIETITIDTALVYVPPRMLQPMRVRAASPLQSMRLSPTLGIPEDSVRSVGRGVWIHDVQVGTGALADSGSALAVHFVGMLADGRTFSATDRRPFTFILGTDQVIAGWEDGILGMRVGGRRQLVIPPHLGYGAAGDRTIPPDAVLVFDVTLVGARRP